MRSVRLAARPTLAVASALVFLQLCAFPVHAAGLDTARAGNEASFLNENETAMGRMMDGMSVKPTGDVDRDFVAMMVPHHQGAIDMAKAELRYGNNEQLRRIAQEIIVEQQQEIVAMRLALGQPLPPSAPALDQQSPAPNPAHPDPRPHHDMRMTAPSHIQKEQ
jgi:hypothetical protein